MSVVNVIYGYKIFNYILVPKEYYYIPEISDIEFSIIMCSYYRQFDENLRNNITMRKTRQKTIYNSVTGEITKQIEYIKFLKFSGFLKIGTCGQLKGLAQKYSATNLFKMVPRYFQWEGRVSRPGVPLVH